MQQPQPGVFETVYFGGGTPSLATAAELVAVLEAVPRADDAEVTVEVNPTLSKNCVSLVELREIGANRVSIGIQSLDDQVLKKMLREHSSGIGLAALEEAATVMSQSRVNVDVIVGVPPAWKERTVGLNKDLERLVNFADHVSVFAFCFCRFLCLN